MLTGISGSKIAHSTCTTCSRDSASVSVVWLIMVDCNNDAGSGQIPLVILILQLRSVYRARPSATRRSLTTATARLQSLAALHQPHPGTTHMRLVLTPAAADLSGSPRNGPVISRGDSGFSRAQLRSRHPGRRL